MAKQNQERQETESADDTTPLIPCARVAGRINMIGERSNLTKTTAVEMFVERYSGCCIIRMRGELQSLRSFPKQDDECRWSWAPSVEAPKLPAYRRLRARHELPA